MYILSQLFNLNNSGFYNNNIKAPLPTNGIFSMNSAIFFKREKKKKKKGVRFYVEKGEILCGFIIVKSVVPSLYVEYINETLRHSMLPVA